jgi:hypothetical protein
MPGVRIADISESDLAQWDRAIELVRKGVAELNELLGYPAQSFTPRTHCVTFGYIGNIEFGKHFELYSVYLPHPNRVGTYGDRIGSVPFGDWRGMRGIAGQLHAFTNGVRYMTRAHGMSQHELVTYSNKEGS